MSARRHVGAAAAVALAVLLSACTTDGDRPEAAPSPPTPATPTPGEATAEPSPEPVVLPAQARPPRDGACYRIGFEEATAPTNDDDPVRCTGRHTARTFFVGRLDTVVDGHLLAVDSRVAQEQVAQACPRRLARFTGGTARERRLSRLEAVWFSPTLEQSDLGASWFRCDVVALGRGKSLAPLPRGLRGVLDRPGALDRVGLCGTAEPGSRGFERVICSRPHAWQAVTTIDITAGPTYPGVGAVREAGEERCRDLVAETSGSPEEFRYGWEWPTRDQWRSGQRYGFCWAPD
ncbi:MAG TPA: septum formation family protein [Nocardioidaceae bacterium]|nr:septum formation family protein [Nocardioidaceae bacterium]